MKHLSDLLPLLLPLMQKKLLMLMARLVVVMMSAQALSAVDESQEKGGEASQPPPVVATTLSPPPPYKSREERDMKLLAKDLDQDRVIWLKSSDEEFLALLDQAATGGAVGSILMLHAEGHHPNWPLTLEPIRTNLPEHGWTTLSILLPVPDTPAIPPRPAPEQASTDGEETRDKGDKTATEARKESEEIFDSSSGQIASTAAMDQSKAAEPAQTPASERSKLPAEERAQQRIAAAISHLHSLGHFNIALIGDGIGAARAGAYFQSLPMSTTVPGKPKDSIKPIRAMVIINARNTVRESNIDLPATFRDPEVAMLDIFFGSDPRDKLESAKRKRQARRNNFINYQQIRLPPLSGQPSTADNRVTRRIRGFLKKYAEGVEVSNARISK